NQTCRGSSIGRACGSYRINDISQTPQGRGFEPRLRLFLYIRCHPLFARCRCGIGPKMKKFFLFLFLPRF
ncbi:hypothetical protein M436DRAFT_53066, partial [Aureobasidium namibiae CBS 147.97]